MNEYFEALCGLFVVVAELEFTTGKMRMIKGAKWEGVDLYEVTDIETHNRVIRDMLHSAKDFERLEAYLDPSTLRQRTEDGTILREDFEFKIFGWGRLFVIPVAGTDTCLFCMSHVDKEIRAINQVHEEMERTNLVLKQALAAANQANQAKTTFLTSMSHDIRTPMNAIIGFTSLAAAHIDNKDAVSNYLKKIVISSNHLLSLINDVLDMSRIESGRTKLEETQVSLPDLLHDLRAIVQSNIHSKQLDFFIDTQDVVHETVMVDKLRLNQVLLNILGNAIKFTPAGGMINLRVIENPCSHPDYVEYEFRIKDSGIGMSREYQQHIFEPFSREETATISGIQGSGLGMAITKNIVDMMNGAIAVNSEEGKGTEFTVILDLKKCGHRVSEEPIPELQNMHVLVADDDFNTCSSVCKMLKTIGMRPEWTTSGKEAVLRTRFSIEAGDEFRAYIIDWLMPDMNGIEVVRRIRAEVGDSTPIIILTAYDWTAIEEEAREAGVTAFCAKPLFLSELRDVLSRPFRTIVPEEEKEIIDYSIFEGKRILMAEDNELNRELATEMLTEFGFEMETADNGQLALELLEARESGYYDLVITDIQMPVMDGYQLARSIRALPDAGKASIPILALTANAFEEDRQQALDAEMNGHLTKPIDIDEVLHTIKHVLYL